MAAYYSTRWRALLFVAAFVACTAAAVAAKKPASIPGPLHVERAIDVGAIVGTPSCAFALNELGSVVGTRNPYGVFRGFSWSSAGLVDLEWDTIALAVNDHGEMAGYGSVTGSGLAATVWTSNGSVTTNVAYGRAYALNNLTQVVGFHIPPNTIYHAFRWTPTGGLEDVESLTGAVPPWSYFTPHSEARFIRDDGVMAGWRDGLAVIWQPSGEVLTLGAGVVTSVNDAGVAAGATSVSDGHPVVWSRLGAAVLSDAIGEATDINAAGYAVGWINVAGDHHAFVWHPEHGFLDLGPGEAFNVDELGHVAGCSGGSWGTSSARATVWQIRMTPAESLLGFEALTRRLLADVDDKESRAAFREIELAQKSLDRSHVRVARRHLDRAIAAIGRLGESGRLPAAWVEALLAIGRSVV